MYIVALLLGLTVFGLIIVMMLAYSSVKKLMGNTEVTTLFKMSVDKSSVNSLISTMMKANFPLAAEIVVQHIGDNVEYYLCVAKKNTRAAEKLIKKELPGVKYEEVEDYLIFHHGGYFTGRFVDISEEEVGKLDISLIDFSKVNELGEGAAVQIVAHKMNPEEKRMVRISVVTSAPSEKQVKEITDGIVNSGFVSKELKEPQDKEEFFDDFNRRGMMMQ
jgi:hypothetical protein